MAPQGVADRDFVYGTVDLEGNEIKGLVESSSDLKAYIATHPKEWAVVQDMLGITRQTSKHASAFVIGEDPIKSKVPMMQDGVTTQYDAKQIEAAGLIKYDFLVVNQLKDIELCISLINKKAGVEGYESGWFDHKGKKTYVWDLPEDLAAFQSIWDGDTETCFQINTQSMVPFVRTIMPRSLNDLSTILALVRPGPLDFIDESTGRNMAEEYIERRFGRSVCEIKELGDLLPETYGVIVYQEQSSKIATEIGKMKPEDAEELRRVFSKKDKAKAVKMKPLFMEGAIKTVGNDKAELIWGQMETASRYNFNLSHSVSYSFITYACVFLKYHYPLEWWAAVLTNASEDEISTKLYKYVKNLMISPDIALSKADEIVIDYNRKKLLGKLSMMRGLGPSASEKLSSGLPYSDIKDFVSKKVAGPALTKRLIHVGVLDSLFPSGLTLIQKMETYEQAVIDIDYENKVKSGKKVRSKKSPVVDPLYLTLSPLKDFCEKKAVLPTLPMNLTETFLRYTNKMVEGSYEKPLFSDRMGKPYKFLTGEEVQRIEKIKDFPNEIRYCFAAYVVDYKEIPYSNNTRKMVKFILDVDGNISEKIMWPDYNTGVLPSINNLQKKCVILAFCKMRPGKEPSLFDVIVEEKTLTIDKE
jgi:DNA polymerase III alpha subunit